MLIGEIIDTVHMQSALPNSSSPEVNLRYHLLSRRLVRPRPNPCLQSRLLPTLGGIHGPSDQSRNHEIYSLAIGNATARLLRMPGHSIEVAR